MCKLLRAWVLLVLVFVSVIAPNTLFAQSISAGAALWDNFRPNTDPLPNPTGQGCTGCHGTPTNLPQRNAANAVGVLNNAIAVNAGGSMGTFSGLTAQQRADLVAYIGSVTTTTATRSVVFNGTVVLDVRDVNVRVSSLANPTNPNVTQIRRVGTPLRGTTSGLPITASDTFAYNHTAANCVSDTVTIEGVAGSAVTANRTFTINITDTTPTTANYNSPTIAWNPSGTVTIDVASAVIGNRGGTIQLSGQSGPGTLTPTGATTFTYQASSTTFASTVTVNFVVRGPCGTDSAIQRQATINIAQPASLPVFSNPTAGDSYSGQVNVAFPSLSLAASNMPSGASPRIWGVTGTLPTGITVNPTTGLVSGTPTQLGTFPVSFTAQNAAGTASVAYTFNIFPAAPTITSGAINVSGQINTAITPTTAPTGTNLTGATFSLTGMGCPPTGLSVNPSTGVISGTPTVLSSASCSLVANNGNPTTASTPVTFNIFRPPVVYSPVGPVALSGQTLVAFTTYTPSATNLPGTAGTFSLSPGGCLPPGLTLSNTATGAIGGTPTAAGTFTCTLNAANGNPSGPFAQTLNFNITLGPPSITSPAAGALPAGAINVAYPAQTIVANNGPNTFSISAGALPPGLTLSPAGVISGTPDGTVITTTTMFNFTVDATNSVSLVGSRAYSITISVSAPTVSSPTTAAGTHNTPFSYQIVGNNSPTSFGVTGTLPTGVTLNPTTGLISGTPLVTSTQVFNVTVSATNAVGTGTRAVAITITLPPSAVNSPATASGSTGNPFSYTITGTNNPTSFTLTGTLPAGLTFNAGTGTISGTPTASGTSTVTIGAANASGGNTQSLTITIGLSAPVVTSAATVSGSVASPFSYTITGTNSPTSFSVTGALPAGVTLNATTGVISGTPSTGGTFNVTVGATNATGTGTLPLTINIGLVPPVITSPATASGSGGAPFSYQITAANQPASFSAVGLPPGLSVNSSTGLITGVPAVVGSFSATITATNSAGSGSSPLMITIGALTPVITSPMTASGVIPAPFSYQITADFLPTSFDATGLPPGLTVNSMTGLISGAPTSFGTFNVTLSATNASGTGTRALTITIANAPPPTAADRTLTVPFNVPQSLDVSTAIGGVVSSITIVAPPTKGVVTIAGNVLTYRPNLNAFGADSFTYAAVGIGGTSSPASVAVTIVTPEKPTAQDRNVSTPFNTPVTFDLASSIGSFATSVSISMPSKGVIVVNGLQVTYTPNSNVFGVDVMSYTATGPGGTSDAANLTVTIQSLLATARPAAMTVQLNTPTTMDMAPFISGSGVSGVQIVTPPKHGTATVSGTNVTYVPKLNYFGTDSLVYRAFGNVGASAPATLSITVIGRPDPLATTSAPEILRNQADTAQRFARTQISNFQSRLETRRRDGSRATVNADADTDDKPDSTKQQVARASGGAGDDRKVVATGNVPQSALDREKRVIEARVDAAIANANGNAHANVGIGSNSLLSGGVSGASNDAVLSATSSVGERVEHGQLVKSFTSTSALDSAASAVANVAATEVAPTFGMTSDQDSQSVQNAVKQDNLVSATAANPFPSPFPFATELASILTQRSLNLALLNSGLAQSTASATSQSGPSDMASTSVWIAGNAIFGSRDRRGTVQGTDFSTSGLTVGVDRRFSQAWVAGLGIGFARDQSNIGLDGSSNRSTGSSAAIYASYAPGNSLFVDMLFGVGTLDFRTVRYVEPINAFAHSKRNGTQLFASLAFGSEYRNNGVTLSPYGRVEITADHLKQTTESGADLYSLTYFSERRSGVQGVIGFRGESIHEMRFGRATPRFRIEYQHDFQKEGSASVSYADIPDRRYVLSTGAVARNALVASLGVDWVRRDGWTFGLDYQVNHTFNRDRAQGLRFTVTKDLDSRGPSYDLQNIFVSPRRPIDIQFDMSYMFDDNVARGRVTGDVFSDSAYSVNAGRSFTYWLPNPHWRGVVSYTLGGEKFNRFAGLSRAMATVQGELQYRTSPAFDAYTFALFGQATAEDYDSRIRDGYKYQIGLSARQAWTDRLSGFAAVSYHQRHGRSQVFDHREAAARFNVDYSLSTFETIYLTAEYRKGSIVSSGQPSLENIGIAEVFVLDDAYPGQVFAYRFKGDTVISTLGYNLGLGPRHSLDFSWRRAQSTPDIRPSFAVSPRSYIVNQYSLVYLVRF